MKKLKAFVFLSTGLLFFFPAPGFSLEDASGIELPASVRSPKTPPDEARLPEVIIKGLNAYKTQGAESAIRAWIHGGPMEGDASALSSADALREVEKVYGPYTGYQYISAQYLSLSVKFIFLQLNYDKGPLFVKFLCFWTGWEWVVSGRFVFNTDPQQVLQGLT